jgi:two-component system NtrC family sensor kinase
MSDHHKRPEAPVPAPRAPVAPARGGSPSGKDLAGSLLALAVSTADFSVLVREVVDRLVPEVGADSAVVVLGEAHRPQECYSSSWGDGEEPPWSSALARAAEETRLPLLVADVATDVRVQDPESLVDQGGRAYLCHPLLASGRLLGTLHLLSRQCARFDDECVDSVAAAAHVLALAVVAAGPAEDAGDRREDEAELLMRLSRSLGALTEKRQVAPLLLETLPRLARPDAAVVLLEEQEGPWDQAICEYRPVSGDLRQLACSRSLEALRHAGASAAEVRRREIRRGSGVLSGRAAADWSSSLHQPVEVAGRPVAQVSLFAQRSRVFAEPHRRMLTTVAAQVALTLERLESVEEAERIHLESVVDAMGDGLLWIDAQYRVRMANPAARELLEELSPGAAPARLERLGQVHLPSLAEQLATGPGGRHHSEFEAGSRRLSLTASAVRGRGDEADGMVLLLADITEQHVLQQKLLQSEKLSALGEMISGVAHELNNPLAAVMGYAQLLDSGVIADETRPEKIRTIHREAFRCQRIVQNLLSFARNQNPERRPTDLNDAARAVVRLLEYSLRVEDIETAMDLSPDLPAVMGDSHQLQQVLLNLVNNAHHALQEVERPRRLGIRTTERDGRVVVEVEDNGPGIPPDKLGKVFDPFFSTKALGKGTGLGLSLAYGCITEHGGEIRVESPPGQGTRFTLELPVSSHAVAETTDDPARGVREWKAARRRRVLVVDDEPSVAAIIAEVVSSAGHEVQVAHDGEEARRQLQSQAVDLIITDLMMPRVSGHELYEEVLRQSPELASRMIFSTGDTVSDATREFLRRTGNAYLTKPFQIAALQELVEEALAKLD